MSANCFSLEGMRCFDRQEARHGCGCEPTWWGCLKVKGGDGIMLLLIVVVVVVVVVAVVAVVVVVAVAVAVAVFLLHRNQTTPFDASMFGRMINTKVI